MSRKLHVEELESRVAPSVGLADFLTQLMQSNNDAASVIGQLVDGDGNVDVGATVDAINSAGGAQVSAINDSFTVSNNTVLSDQTAENILNLFSRR